MQDETLEQAIAAARACTICAEHLPLGPRPVFRASHTARLLIVGQAPGTMVHETGIPWNDRSGDRLRDWLGLDRETFYDESRIAILPAGFCYPGRHKRGGDLPPRPECAPMWHRRLTAHMPDIELTLLAGRYAQAHYLGRRRCHSLAATVAPGATTCRITCLCRIRAGEIPPGCGKIRGSRRNCCRCYERRFVLLSPDFGGASWFSPLSPLSPPPFPSPAPPILRAFSAKSARRSATRRLIEPSG